MAPPEAASRHSRASFVHPRAVCLLSCHVSVMRLVIAVVALEPRACHTAWQMHQCFVAVLVSCAIVPHCCHVGMQALALPWVSQHIVVCQCCPSPCTDMFVCLSLHLMRRLWSLLCLGPVYAFSNSLLPFVSSDRFGGLRKCYTSRV